MLGLLVNQAYGGNYEECKQIIVAIELIHQGSLMQDDIIDRDKMRRGKPTVAEAMSIAKGVAGGQKLVAMGLKVGFGRGARVVQTITQALQELIEGNTLDLQGPGWNKAMALKVADMKTGSLYGAASRLGAILARSYDKDIEIATSYGRAIGVAFQLADDMVDVVKSAAWGKLDGDMGNRKVTVPLIHLHDSLDNQGRTILEKYRAGQLLMDTDKEQIFNAIKESKAIQTTLTDIEAHIINARNNVAKDISQDYYNIMMEIPSYFVNEILNECAAEKWW
jgi:geranylgeranyl pyrophosphate synthase